MSKKSNWNLCSRQARRLFFVRKWTEFYAKKYDLFRGEKSPEALRECRNEISQFVGSIKSRWMGRRFAQLSPEHRKLLITSIKTLNSIEKELSVMMIEREREQIKLTHLENLAYPEESYDEDQRDLVKWARSPLYFPEKLLSDLAKETPIKSK